MITHLPRFAVLLLFGFLAAAPTVATEPVSVLDAEQLVELVNSTPRLVLVDSRIPSDRRHGYIEGSLSLPDTETDCTSLARVVGKPDTPVVFYCNGPRCGRSERAVRVAQRCGLTNIFWLKGGFEEWSAKGYPYLLD